MYGSLLRAGWVLVLCSLLVGCNVFEGMGAEGESDDPQVLLRDARAALDRGEPQRAVRYLERALELDPANPEVRIVLAGARFSVAGIDLLTLERLVDHINGADGAPAGTAAARRGKASSPYCTFSADPARLDPFDYTTIPEYQQIREQIDTFVAVRDLLAEIRPSVLEALPEETQAQGYLVHAFTRIVLAIDGINSEVERIDATLYRLPRLQNSIGICAASKTALEQAEARIKCDFLPQILIGLDELERRSELLGEADVSGVIDDLRQAADVVGAQLDTDVIRFCSVAVKR